MKMRSRLEQNLGIAALALVAIGCIVVLLPFISALPWAAVVCYCPWPFYLWLTRVLNGRKTLAASIMVTLVALVLVVPFVVVGFTLAGNVPRLVGLFRDLVSEGLPEVPEWLGAVPVVGPPVEDYWQHLAGHPEQVAEFARHTLTTVRSWLFHRGVDLGHGVLQLTLSVPTTDYCDTHC